MKRSYSLRSPESQQCEGFLNADVSNSLVSQCAATLRCQQPQRKKACHNSRAAEILSRTHIDRSHLMVSEGSFLDSATLSVSTNDKKQLHLYGEGETVEQLTFETQDGLLKYVDSQISSLPASVSLIGLRQMQQVLFQLNSYCTKQFENDNELFRIHHEAMSLPCLEEKENYQKKFIALFEIYRYIASKTGRDVSFKYDVIQSAQELIGQCDQPIKCQKFLQDTFLEWYLDQPCEALASSFVSEACFSRPDILNALDLSKHNGSESDSDDEKENVFYHSNLPPDIPISEPDAFVMSSQQGIRTVDVDGGQKGDEGKPRGTPEALSQRARKRFSTRSNLKFLEEESSSKKLTSSKSQFNSSNSSERKSILASEHLSRQRRSSSTNRLHSRMLQRSLSQNGSLESRRSSVATESKLAADKSDTNGSSLHGKGRKSLGEKETADESKRKFDSSGNRNTNEGRKSSSAMASKNILRQDTSTEKSRNKTRKRLLTNKVLETPGFKLLSKSGKPSIFNSGSGNSRLQTEEVEPTTPADVRETPLHKMPRTSYLEVSKINTSCRTSKSSQNSLSTKSNRSFYTQSSNVAAKNSPKKDSSDAGNSQQQIEIYQKKRMTPGRCDYTVSPLRINGLVSPYSIVFERDQDGSISAVITPAKVRAEFSDDDFELLDDSVSCRTPLAGFLNKLTSSAKKIRALDSLSALSIVEDTVDIDGIGNNQFVQRQSVSRSFNSGPIFNLKLSASKKVSDDTGSQKSRKAIRKSLFAANGKSPKKFTAKSSFHDDDAPKAYQILCDNSNSMDVLAELTDSQNSENNRLSRFGESFKILQSDTREQAGNISSVSRNLETNAGSLSFHLRRKFSNLGDSGKQFDVSWDCSPSPVHEFPAFFGSQPSFSGNFVSTSNVGHSKNDDRSAARRKAIEDLLQNPITDLNK